MGGNRSSERKTTRTAERKCGCEKGSVGNYREAVYTKVICNNVDNVHKVIGLFTRHSLYYEDNS